MSFANADIVLPKLFSDHMVLQQNQSMRIRGTADAGEKLKVSFNQQVIETEADKNGRWSAVIQTGPAGGPFQLEVASRDSDTRAVFRDVLVGEVWICSGQANMRFPVRGTMNSEAEIADAKNYPLIRGFSVGQSAAVQPLNDFENAESWFCCSPDSIKNFSAIAYLFARELNRKMGVPIGLVLVASEGTTLEAWTPYDAMKNEGSFEQLLKHWEERAEPANPNRVSNSYNAMIAPLRGYSFRGVIWYQGESNIGRGAQYRRMFPLMIKSWRKNLGQPECPFLFVQPAPFRYEEKPVEALPEIWDAQLETLNQVQGTGMVVSLDLGTTDRRQPVAKLPIARRLSYWALANCYAPLIKKMARRNEASAATDNVAGDRTTEQDSKSTLVHFQPAQSVFSGPLFKSSKTDQNRIQIDFEMAEGGLILDNTIDHQFTICGPDRKFLPAHIKLSDNRITLWHPQIQSPIAVRYGWTDTAKAALRNASGLPASSFRTDDFPLISSGIEF